MTVSGLPETQIKVCPGSNITERLSPQIDTSSVSSETVQLESSVCPQEEILPEDPQTEQQPAESTKGEPEVETLTSAQPEEPHVVPPAESEPLAAETAESQTMVSPQSEAVPENSSPAQSELRLETHCQPREKTKSSPGSEQQQRPLTRRQLQLEECLSPEQYNLKLRSSGNSAQQLSPSPQQTKKTKSAKSAHQKGDSMEQPPSKKARGGNVSAMVENQENSQATVSETPQTGILYCISAKVRHKEPNCLILYYSIYRFRFIYTFLFLQIQNLFLCHRKQGRKNKREIWEFSRWPQRSLKTVR